MNNNEGALKRMSVIDFDSNTTLQILEENSDKQSFQNSIPLALPKRIISIILRIVHHPNQEGPFGLLLFKRSFYNSRLLRRVNYCHEIMALRSHKVNS